MHCWPARERRGQGPGVGGSDWAAPDAVEEAERASAHTRVPVPMEPCVLAPTPTTPRPPQAGAPAPWSAPAVGGAEALAPARVLRPHPPASGRSADRRGGSPRPPEGGKPVPAPLLGCSPADVALGSESRKQEEETLRTEIWALRAASSSCLFCWGSQVNSWGEESPGGGARGPWE